jgi:hypothetical protein
MTKERFTEYVNRFQELLSLLAPKDTGNLAFNSIRVEWHGDKEAAIYVDENIAPYMPYTNETWVSDRWNGKQNPNEAWWQNAIAQIVEQLNIEFGGVTVERP